jgi:hypothetical protein
MTGHTTRTVTSYTGTETSTSTRVVYTTVTKSGAGAAASSPLAYLGFLSLLGITVGRRVTASKAKRVRHVTSHRELLSPSCLRSLSPHFVDHRDTIQKFKSRNHLLLDTEVRAVEEEEQTQRG